MPLLEALLLRASSPAVAPGKLSVRIAVLDLQGNNLDSAAVRRLIGAALRSRDIIALNLLGNPGFTHEEEAMLLPHLQQNRRRKLQERAQPKKISSNALPSAAGEVQTACDANRQAIVRPPRPSVAIVGGGIAGLALALALHRRGISSTVFERDTSFDERRQGYGLTLQQGSKAIVDLGLGKDVVKVAAQSSSHFIFDSGGSVLAFWGPTRIAAAQEVKKCRRKKRKIDPVHAWSQVGKHNMHIPRQSLRRVLWRRCAEDIGPSTIRWGSMVQSIVYDKETRQCRLSIAPRAQPPDVSCKQAGDPATSFTVLADAVVACDGIHSKMRRQLLDDDLNFLGLIVILGIFNSSAFPLCRQRVFQMSDGNARIFVMPFSSETTSMWQLTIPMSQSLAKETSKSGASALKALAVQTTSDWSNPVSNIIRSTETDLVSGYPVYDREPMQVPLCAATGPITLAGDAAHCMSPLKGQGANQAMLDAIDIADALQCTLDSASQVGTSDSAVSYATAFRHYEAAMIARSTGKVLASRRACDLLHCPEFLSTSWQMRRKSCASTILPRIEAMKRASVGASSDPQLLDKYAFE